MERLIGGFKGSKLKNPIWVGNSSENYCAADSMIEIVWMLFRGLINCNRKAMLKNIRKDLRNYNH